MRLPRFPSLAPLRRSLPATTIADDDWKPPPSARRGRPRTDSLLSLLHTDTGNTVAHAFRPRTVTVAFRRPLGQAPASIASSRVPSGAPQGDLFEAPAATLTGATGRAHAACVPAPQNKCLHASPQNRILKNTVGVWKAAQDPTDPPHWLPRCPGHRARVFVRVKPSPSTGRPKC
jgi:hypothetical protein